MPARFSSDYAKLLWPQIRTWYHQVYMDYQPKKEQKVYIIKLGNKRFNSKNFDSYESARKYVRRIITARFGKYQDNIGDVGFTIVTK